MSPDFGAANTVINVPLQLHAPCKSRDKTGPQDDAGAVFVLESKGTWAHAGYHLTSATAGAPLLTLPFAMAGLGWGPGVLALSMGSAVSFYACNCLSSVAEHMEANGKRSFRYRDLTNHIFGPNWTNYLIAPLQFIVCFMVVIGSILLGGQTMKAMFLAVNPVVHLQLYEFIIIFGVSTLLISQLPSFHSLRHLSFLSILLCLGFSLCAVCGSIIAGISKNAPDKDYSLTEITVASKIFKVFNSISIMITAFSNPLIVETQATLAPPVAGKMLKGLAICYTVVVSTFFSVALSGYWAFGNASEGVIFTNMLMPGRDALVPTRLYFIGNACACFQLIINAVLHLQPSFEKYEGMVADAEKGRFSARNVVPRLVGRSAFVAVATLLAAMLPFFADFSAFMGAMGFTPLCIALPLLLYSRVLKPTTRSPAFWLNYPTIVCALVIMVLGGKASMGQIVLDAKTFKLFANL